MPRLTASLTWWDNHATVTIILHRMGVWDFEIADSKSRTMLMSMISEEAWNGGLEVREVAAWNTTKRISLWYYLPCYKLFVILHSQPCSQCNTTITCITNIFILAMKDIIWDATYKKTVGSGTLENTYDKKTLNNTIGCIHILYAVTV